MPQFTPMKLAIGGSTAQTVKVPWVTRFADATVQLALLINDVGAFGSGLYMNIPAKGWQPILLAEDFYNLEDLATFTVYYLTPTPVAQGSGVILYQNGTKTNLTSVPADNNIWVAAIPNGAQIASGTGNLIANGGVIALSEVAPVVTLTATGLAFTGACEYAGLNIRAVTGTVNIVVYDATSATGTPIHTENNVTLGGKPWMGAGTTARRANTTGLYLSISGGGTVTVDALVN